MVHNFKFLIRQYIKEYIDQHENFKDKDLNIIGKNLINKLQNVGFLIKKSNVSFPNVYTFDAEKLGKVYQVNIRKKFHSINEDGVEKFNRDELKKIFPSMFKNNTQGSYVKNKNLTNISKKSIDHNEYDDDTIVSRTDDILYARNFEYTIEFQDKSKNYDIVIHHKKIFNNKKDNFENFVNEFISDIVKNFNK